MPRLPLSGKKNAKRLMTNLDEVKDKLYDGLDSVMSSTPRTDKLIHLGDFSGRVCTDHESLEGVTGTKSRTK